MASYKPISLDEFNSIYDKSLNAKNEINKNAAVLGVKSEQQAPAAAEAEAQPEPEKTREEAANEEISGLVDDFIKSFGTPVAVKKVRPASVAATAVKAVGSAKAAETKTPSNESVAPAAAATPSAEKPRLIRSNERNELFEDYKKVMDDEDDDEGSRLRLGRRKGKKLFEKKNAPDSVDTEAQTLTDEVSSVNSYEGIIHEAETPAISEIPETPEIPETLENIDAVIEKVLGNSYTAEAPVDEEIVIEPQEEEIPEAEEEPEVLEITEEADEPVAEEISEEEATAEPQVIYELIEKTQEEPTDEEAVDAAEEAVEEEAAEEAEASVPAEEAIEADDDYDESVDYLAALYKDDISADIGNDEYSADYVTDNTEKEAITKKEQKKKDKKVKKAKKSKPRSKKRYGLKNLLLILLLFVLILATAVSAIKAFSGINSDTLMLDSYYLYTSDSSFTQAGINKGDLVVISHEPVKEGDIFAFKKGDGEYGFATFESVLNEDSIIADTDGQKSIVFLNTLRGVFVKTIPTVGAIAAVIISQYLYVMGAFTLAAVILLLIIILAFRDKKDKTEKKSRRAVAAEAEDTQDEYTAETTEEDSDRSPYDAVDDNFKYLIQEDGDDLDIYRPDESNETDEDGVPVYQAENYKYEPDEYVDNTDY